MKEDPQNSDRLPDPLAQELSSPTQYVGDNLHFLADAYEDFQQALDGYQALLDELARGAAPDGLLDAARDLAKSLDLDFLRREVPLALREAQLGIAEIGSRLDREKCLVQKT